MRSRIAALLALIALPAALPAQTSTPLTPHPRPGSGPLIYTTPADTPAPSAQKQAATEDWTSISLPKGGLTAMTGKGVSLSKVDLPGCTRELVRMQWRVNDPIDVYVIRPNGPGKAHVALFLYSYIHDTDIFRQDRWCDRAKQNNYAVVGFASALSLSRLHSPRPMKEWFVSELQEALSSSAHDVQMILNSLETRDDLDAQHVAMFGESSGGAVAILAAAADSRITALDLMDPWGDWPDFLKGSRQIPEDERAAYTTPEFIKKVAGLDPVDYLPRLKDRALRIQQVMDDPIMPRSAQDKLAAAAPGENIVMRYPDRAAEAKALGANGITGWLGDQFQARNAANSPQPQPSGEGAPHASGSH